MPINQALATVPFFSALTDHEREMLGPLCSIHEGKEGDHLIFEGAPVEHIYCLLSGKVGVYKKDKEGKKVLIASLGKGFIFGEMSFLDHGPASATVRAGLPFQVLTVNQEALHRLLESQPKLGCKILGAIARQTSLRLRQADDILAGLPGGSAHDFTVA
ncbi:MAG: cyclic nucleotide-binding domain-containing protein [Nitrospirae bacterium]|nr:MAG: cyclic nucleotide-binding domain-containing protein [Nitrospirota bacterium]